MIARFCLYGFLKNQRYFEPFLVLALMERGHGLFAIGLLIAIRDITVNIVEVPSGAMADGLGRRRTMIASLLAYMVSFVLFSVAGSFALLAVAMMCFAVGDAFRSGTHKTMIFTWLRLQDRLDERTKVYGFTRSWSKLGSALSAAIAMIIVIMSADYASVFLWCLVPYAIGVINLATYPAEIDPPSEHRQRIGEVFSNMKAAFVLTLRSRPLRRLSAESTSYEGMFDAGKEFLQPLVQAFALGLFATQVTSSEAGDVALIMGPIAIILFIASAWASRLSHRLVARCGGEAAASWCLWVLTLLIYAMMLTGAVLASAVTMIVAFILLYLAQNLWRPILIARFDDHAPEEQAATVLSIESQAKRLGTAVFAPVLGYLIEYTGTAALPWPVAAGGCAIALIWALFGRPRRDHQASALPTMGSSAT